MGWFRKHVALIHGLMAIFMVAFFGIAVANGNAPMIVYDGIFVVYNYVFTALYLTVWKRD